jgi:hypothetical protein
LRIIRQGYFGHGPEVRNPFGQFIDFLVPAWVVARASPKKLDLSLPVSGNGPFPVIVSIDPGFDEGDEGSAPAPPIRGDAVVAVNYQPYQPFFAGDMGGAAFHQVMIGDNLGPDETAFEVTMNFAGGLGRPGAFGNGPDLCFQWKPK